MISTEEFLNILKTDEKKVFKLGKIDPNYVSGDPKILFDGETTVSVKKYKTINYSPFANDRVLLVNIADTYLILGKIGSGGSSGGESYDDAELRQLINDLGDNIGNLEILNTTEKTNLVEAINELFTNVNDGKGLIATAIVDKGGVASGSDTFTNLATEISNLPSGGLNELVAGDSAVIYMDEDRKYLTNDSYAKLREIQVNFSGTVRITFSIGYARVTIYKNGVAVGIERVVNSATNETSFVQDFTVVESDLIQLYGMRYKKTTTGSNTIFKISVTSESLGACIVNL